MSAEWRRCAANFPSGEGCGQAAQLPWHGNLPIWRVVREQWWGARVPEVRSVRHRSASRGAYAHGSDLCQGQQVAWAPPLPLQRDHWQGVQCAIWQNNCSFQVCHFQPLTSSLFHMSIQQDPLALACAEGGPCPLCPLSKVNPSSAAALKRHIQRFHLKHCFLHNGKSPDSCYILIHCISSKIGPAYIKFGDPLPQLMQRPGVFIYYSDFAKERIMVAITCYLTPPKFVQSTLDKSNSVNSTCPHNSNSQRIPRHSPIL